MPKKSEKNSFMSEEGLKLLKKANASAVSDIENRTKPPARVGDKAPKGAPGEATHSRMMQERERSRTGTRNVRTVKPGSTRIGPLSGRGGGGGAGGGWMDQIR